MNSIILCEGSTDFVLLQYFMREVYGWEDIKNQDSVFKGRAKRSRIFEKSSDKLTIVGCGGSARLLPVLKYVLERNSLSSDAEAYDRIVLITDRDEIDTEDIFLNNIKQTIHEYKLQGKDVLANDTWAEYAYENGQGNVKQVMILLLVIPFEETGAMETFLLDAIANDNSYDADIIKKGNSFVHTIDPEKRYLTKRRYLTKAKFDIYFSVRTAAEQFVERQNILKNVEWEKYVLVQKSFRKLGELCNDR